MSLLSGVRTVIRDIIKMTHLFHHYQMRKIKELLKAHSILHSLGIVSTFKLLKSTFKELAPPPEISTGVKFICAALRSVILEAAGTAVCPKVRWQPSHIRVSQACCTSPGNTLPHTNTERVLGHICSGVMFEGLLSLWAVKLFLQTV